MKGLRWNQCLYHIRNIHDVCCTAACHASATLKNPIPSKSGSAGCLWISLADLLWRPARSQYQQRWGVLTQHLMGSFWAIHSQCQTISDHLTFNSCPPPTPGLFGHWWRLARSPVAANSRWAAFSLPLPFGKLRWQWKASGNHTHQSPVPLLSGHQDFKCQVTRRATQLAPPPLSALSQFPRSPDPSTKHLHG
jgi:hypothetical protein